MTRKTLLLLALVALLVAAASAAATATQEHAKSNLEPVGDLSVHGKVHLRQLSSEGSEGTRILVQARGLTPGNEYISLYYDNPTCEIEPYSEDDVIGGLYTANPDGNAHTSGVADDDLDEIESVSVRNASFELLACADVHP